MREVIPAPVARAFDGRLSLSVQETADLLEMDKKTLVEHVKAGNIGYISKGLGQRNVRREFTLSDVVGFLERMRQRECPSIDPKTRRTTTTISSGEVIGFTARLAKRSAEKPKRSSAPSARR